jgi:hypothetical protein
MPGEVLIFALEAHDLDRVAGYRLRRGNVVGEEPAVAFGREAGNVETVLDGDRQVINN